MQCLIYLFNFFYRKITCSSCKSSWFLAGLNGSKIVQISFRIEVFTNVSVVYLAYPQLEMGLNLEDFFLYLLNRQSKWN